MILTLVFIGFLIPTIGLSIDVGVLYSIRARLSMSVDAAALAGARALAQGTPAQQTGNAQTAATNYVHLNFPNSYFSSYNLTIPTPTVDVSIPGQRTVTVNATVTAPLYFLRWVGSTTTTVAAQAQVVRRNANVMLVMDRSGSLQIENACAPLIQSATNFVNSFSAGSDALGLVTFASSSRIDNSMSTTYTGIQSTISQLSCAGFTNTSHGLWRGYDELVRYNKVNSFTNALNVMVLFTDGTPTAFTAAFPIKGTTCKVPANTPAVMAIDGISPSTGPNYGPFGLMEPNAIPQPTGSDVPMLSGNTTNCAFSANWGGNSGLNVPNDVTYMPGTDAQGSSLNTGFSATLGGGYGSQTTSGGGYALTQNNMWSMAMDGADDTANRIRNGVTDPAQGQGITRTIMFSIGLNVPYNSTTSLSPQGLTFLKRVANDPSSSNFNVNLPAGLFLEVNQTADLNSAFARVAAEILRIAK